jgi:hypothetical protein
MRVQARPTWQRHDLLAATPLSARASVSKRALRNIDAVKRRTKNAQRHRTTFFVTVGDMNLVKHPSDN